MAFGARMECYDSTWREGGRKVARAAALSRMPTPSYDLSEWLERLGCKLFSRDRPLIRYVSWCHELGLLELVSKRPITIGEACRSTRLNEAGADALLGVLCGLRIAVRRSDGRYALSEAARDYFSPSSPLFIVDHLYPPPERVPPTYIEEGLKARVWARTIQMLPSVRAGTKRRLANQNVRNMPACIAAVRSGQFRDVRCLVDVAGGGGAFSIPLALEYPEMRVILADLPAAVKNVPDLFARHGVTDRIELRALDAFACPWDLPECDGIFIGNFLHGFADEPCVRVCRQAYARLTPGGRIWLHEMLWNPNRDGPLVTALWNASMRAGGGRQRTAEELERILTAAGFESPYVVPTAGAFALVAARKPMSPRGNEP